MVLLSATMRAVGFTSRLACGPSPSWYDTPATQCSGEGPVEFARSSCANIFGKNWLENEPEGDSGMLMPNAPSILLVALVMAKLSKSTFAVRLQSSKSPFAKLDCPAVFWK